MLRTSRPSVSQMSAPLGVPYVPSATKVTGVTAGKGGGGGGKGDFGGGRMEEIWHIFQEDTVGTTVRVKIGV